MRSTTKATLEHYLEQLQLSGDVLEIGALSRAKSAVAAFPAPRFRYRNCDLAAGNVPDTIQADITCCPQIPDDSYDVIISCDVFEHIDRPWLAAAEIARILRPGGIVLTRTVWAWRNHPCPIDYWRFSPQCLDFLFDSLECLELGYDLSERRADYPGFWRDGGDSVPVDELGGFRENWAVYSVHRKGTGRAVPEFKTSAHPLARHLRQDTQGRVTNPQMLTGSPATEEPVTPRSPAIQEARRAVALARELAADPKRVARQFRPRRVAMAARAHQLTRRKPAAAPQVVLTPDRALRENGFTIFRSLFSAAECAQLSTALKGEAGITDGTEFTRVDATNKFPTTHQVLFDDRVLDAVRTAVREPARFLQVSDLHYLHDTAGWHRDSVHRAHDSSAAADWSDDTYRVVKAILYLESDNAAMGIIAGSHLSQIEFDRDLVKSIEKRGGQLVIGPSDEPNRRLSSDERVRPLAWQAQVGDLLVFDERLYHAGRRVSGGRVSAERDAAKFTLSLVFGADNHHSDRLYAYFRYARRELHYKDFAAEFHAKLAAHDLVLSNGLGNYYLQHPEELRLAHLRHPETMDDLVAEFTAVGRQTARTGRPPA